MNCPICSDVSLVAITLEAGLTAQQCPTCRGIWIASNHYWGWVAHPPLIEAATQEATEATEVDRAKRCPHCHYLMMRYRIALDLSLMLDQCGHCNSFWLDGGEWSALRQRNLHTQLHHIADKQWQQALHQEESRRAWEKIYIERFGTDDYAELCRIKNWLATKPNRDVLLAFLAHIDV